MRRVVEPGAYEKRAREALDLVGGLQQWEVSRAICAHGRLSELLYEGRSGSRRRSMGWMRDRLRRARKDLCRMFHFPKV